jgi:uncharacterized membrane protein YdfJ with MMPL/SSD domain
MARPPDVPLGAGGRAFQRLGRGIVAHPWRPVALWVILLVLALPLLAQLGHVTQNSASDLPASSPSSVAASDLARLYPTTSVASSSLLLFTGTNLTDATGQRVVLAVTSALASDPKLTEIAGVDSLYSAYAGYLAAQGTLAQAILTASLNASDPHLNTGAMAELLWGPPALFFQSWEANVTAHPSATPSSFNYPSFVAAQADEPTGSAGRGVLGDFYNGTPGIAAGFNASVALNGSGDCARLASAAGSCLASTVAANEGPLLMAFLPANTPASARFLGAAVLSDLGVGNFSNSTAWPPVTFDAVALGSGLSAPFLSQVWSAFDTAGRPPPSTSRWATAIADGPTGQYPLPIPRSVQRPFVSSDGSAELIYVSFAESDSTTTSTGASPVFNDVREIDRIVPTAVSSADPSGGIGYVQTGPAPLDADESSVLSANLAIVLPLTIAILVLITVLYFRSPVSPLVTFSGLGIAIGLGLAGLVAIALLFGKVDQTAITLENTFVLGVGTDYSIFLVARYREELRGGAESHDAVVTAVTWAGQSVATSGGTAILATLALAFSGVGLLSQWGETLSLAVFITVLVALTLVPALLTIIGPRVFWPEVGERARRVAASSRAEYVAGTGYFHRAGILARRRPAMLIVLILLVSVPLAYVAVTAPLSYDFYQQLPSAPGPTDGLAALGQHFGPGDAFPMQILMTFPAPLIQGSTPNASEFVELSQITATVEGTAGVASVQSPIGPDGAGLSEWLAYGSDLPGTQAQLIGTLAPYLGTDGQTIVLTVTPASSGLSTSAVSLLRTLEDEVPRTTAGDPGAPPVHIEYGGGAAVTSDLAEQTALATERMILAVCIGLIIVLFVVLRSVVIPPLAVATIGLSIGWAWGATQVVFTQILGLGLFFFVPTVLFLLILGLGIDYNIFLLTRVREERLRGRSSRDAVLEGVTRTGGIITAAAIILGSAFAVLGVGNFVLLRAIGFSVATAVILDALVVRTYLVPASLNLLGDRVWQWRGPRNAVAAADHPIGPDPPDPN